MINLYLNNIEEQNQIQNNFFNNINLITTIQCYGKIIYCLKILYDNRLATGDYNSYLIIYNKNTLNPEIKINNKLGGLTYIEQLKNKKIAASFKENAIRIYSIEKDKYFILQTIDYIHENWVYKIIELSNNFLLSCSSDGTFVLWNYIGLHYEETYKSIKEDFYILDIIEINENEFVYNIGHSNANIVFFDISKKEKKVVLNNFELSYYIGTHFTLMDNKTKLIIGGNKKIYILDVINYKILNEIDFNSFVTCIFKLNENDYLIGDEFGYIHYYNLKNSNSILTKNIFYKNAIYSLLFFNNKNLIIGGENYEIKIWN